MKLHWSPLTSIIYFGLSLGAPAASPIPQEAFPESHYESLWLKSPFAISSVASDQSSLAYELVGLAKIDDGFYVNLLERQTGEIFVVTNTKPSHGFTLDSVHRGDHLEECYAVLERDDQTLTLHLKPSGHGEPESTPVNVPQVSSPAASHPEVPAILLTPSPTGK